MEDLDNAYDSDETILNAVEGFEIEEWDWKRRDISSSVVAGSSTVVRDVTLYSQHESILDDWCGDKGFSNDSLFPEVCLTHSHSRLVMSRMV